MDVASHQNYDVGDGDCGKQLAVLCFFQICAVELLHQPYGIGVDIPNFRSCGKAVENIACEQFSEAFSDLTTAGIVYANESDFRFAVADCGAAAVFCSFITRLILSQNFHIFTSDFLYK